jgi:chemotaxis protein MotA
LGLLTAFGLILAAIFYGGSALAFIDPPSILIVIGGTTATLAVGFPTKRLKTAFLKASRPAFRNLEYDAEGTIKMLSELSNRARREGLLSLETAADEAEDEFLARGLRLMADGHEAGTIESVMFGELDKTSERHNESILVYDSIGVFGPAMGLIGTLIGLVQMLGKLDDPTAIGPAMAVALLTTFYGSVLANVVGLPLAQKLKCRSAQEVAYKELIMAGLLSILAGENPRFMVERLNATLAPDQRLEEAA